MNFVYSSTWPLGSRIRPLLGSSPVRPPATLHGVDSLDSENTPEHSRVVNAGLGHRSRLVGRGLRWHPRPFLTCGTGLCYREGSEDVMELLAKGLVYAAASL